MAAHLSLLMKRAFDLPVLLAALGICLGLGSCTTREPFRAVKEATVRDHVQHAWQQDRYVGKLRQQGGDRRAAYPGRDKACLEKYVKSNFWIGHVEFTDYGSFQDHKQLDVVERALEADLKSGGKMFRHGMTMMVFVHGWHNNAKDDNSNLEDFRMLVNDMAHRELEHPQGTGGMPRGVLGVYVSWRGASVTLPVLKHLTTYWNRKRAAHDFGHGNLVETLARLKNLEWLVARGGQEDRAPSKDVFAKCRMVCVGHSFGGAALYSAVAQPLEARFLEPYWDKRRFGTGSREEKTNRMDRVAGTGDLVVLINPAFEALPYRTLHHAMSTNTNVAYDQDQSVLMMVLQSRNDWPNHTALPVGQLLANRFMDWFPGRSQRREAEQRTTAIGHFAGYHTHQLDLAEDGHHVVLKRDPAFFGYGLVKSEDGEDFPQPRQVKILEKDYHLASAFSNVRVQDLSDQDLQALPEMAGQPKLAAQKLGGPGLLPFMVVSVDGKIINGHNGFWPVPAGTDANGGPKYGNAAAYEFLRSFIAVQNQAVGESRTLEAAKGQAQHRLR